MLQLEVYPQAPFREGRSENKNIRRCACRAFLPVVVHYAVARSLCM